MNRTSIVSRPDEVMPYQQPLSFGEGSDPEKLSAEKYSIEYRSAPSAHIQDIEDAMAREAAGVGKDGELQVKRDLSPFQISMIAIGGSIGTGLVIGTGSALYKSGPASLFIGYSMMGMVCYMVLCALGELSSWKPTRRGFSGHAAQYVGPSFGFACALNYLMKYLVISPNQLVASAMVVHYWLPNVSAAAWISPAIVAIVTLNFLGVKAFGIVESILSMAKVIVLTGLILLLLIIDLGGVPGQERIGFRYWEHGNGFKEYKSTGSTGRFLGFFEVLNAGLFAYMGSELIGVTVGEAQNPRKTVPKAIKMTFYRIIFFYIVSVLLVGMCVDSNGTELADATEQTGNAAASPFVVAIQIAKIKALPHIVNACLLIFTLSAANSDQYIASRTLYGLAMDGKAPSIFRHVNQRGVPYASLGCTCLFLALAYMATTSSGSEVFTLFTNTVTIFGAIAWACILISHIRFVHACKVQGFNEDLLPYKAPFRPYGSYAALFLITIIVIFKGWSSFVPWDHKTFITHYFGLPVFFIVWIGHWIWTRTPLIVKMEEMDLYTGAREFNEASVSLLDEEAEKNLRAMPLYRRISKKLFS